MLPVSEVYDVNANIISNFMPENYESLVRLSRQMRQCAGCDVEE